LELRDRYPVLIFEKQEYSLGSRGLEIVFTFDLAGGNRFHPRYFIPARDFFLPDGLVRDNLENIIFNIGMIELISYWKAACPPRVIIKPFTLHPDQVLWWKRLYYNGLGEFFYLNSIRTNETDFMSIEADRAAAYAPKAIIHANTAFRGAEPLIIPVGGGKDSAVTLELLGDSPGAIPLIMNPRQASLDTVTAKGIARKRILEISRVVDPGLLELNEQGFLNGHTPFSALLAFVTALSAILTGAKHIALSNESSASEATIEGTGINHQYSKSFQFETDFREYVTKWICSDIDYFSFLRPVNELQIASVFARYPKYHPVFRSCNAGSKTDSWCGVCAKCLFTWIILSPFLGEEQLTVIFGHNLLENGTLQPILEQLTGIAKEKPFDCVGTVNEVNLALCETIRQQKDTGLPFLLRYYKNSTIYENYCRIDFGNALSRLSGERHLPPLFFKILQENFDMTSHTRGD